MELPRVIVIGGGVAGLVAAYRLRACARVTLLEATGRVGGKLVTSRVAGLPADEGAESFLARRPEALRLAGELGLDVVAPATTRAALLLGGRLRPLPSATLLGVPADVRALSVLSARGRARALADLALPAAARNGDVSVGALVGARFGREVVERLVDPLLGGVYAGHADALSLAATIPQLAARARAHRSLLLAARAARAAAPSVAGPPFVTIPGGLGRLPAALVAAMVRDGVEVRPGERVRSLARTSTGWLVEGEPADAVVVAVPAAPAARLLRTVAPAAATELAAIETASVALVTLAYRRVDLPALPAYSGWLVPATEHRPVKAVTLTSRKWAHLDTSELVLARASLGRAGEARTLQRDDAELARLAAGELAAVLGTRAAPVTTRVTRWGGGLPQYAVGHVDRVARIRAAVACQPGLAVAGAAYDGVGVPAVISSAERAAEQVRAALRQWRREARA